MGLLSFFKRDKATPAAKRVSDSADAVQQLRLRARHRLIGAAVLVGVGVIGFPLVFETQPRPIPVDLPIDIPSKDGAPPLAIPQARALPQSLPPVAAADEAASTAGGRDESAKLASVPSPVPLSSPPLAEARPATAAPKAPEKAAEKAAEKSTVRPVEHGTEKSLAERPADKSAAKPLDNKAAEVKAAEKRMPGGAQSLEAARVQALLEGRSKPADSGAATRHILQIGAYADSKAAQDVRIKVERLGLKTYTQAVDTSAGKRIRVRLGPYASREEADKAANKLKAAGLSAAVLTL